MGGGRGKVIIVNQNRDMIVNLDSVTIVAVGDRTIYITNAIRQDSGCIIAMYDTVERAKEVLDELTKRILLTERFKALKSVGGQESMINKMYDDDAPLFIYEMPKE